MRACEYGFTTHDQECDDGVLLSNSVTDKCIISEDGAEQRMRFEQNTIQSEDDDEEQDVIADGLKHPRAIGPELFRTWTKISWNLAYRDPDDIEALQNILKREYAEKLNTLFHDPNAFLHRAFLIVNAELRETFTDWRNSLHEGEEYELHKEESQHGDRAQWRAFARHPFAFHVAKKVELNRARARPSGLH